MRIIAKRSDESYLLVEEGVDPKDINAIGIVVSEGTATENYVQSVLARGYWEDATGRGDYLLRGLTIRRMPRSDMLRSRG